MADSLNGLHSEHADGWQGENPPFVTDQWTIESTSYQQNLLALSKVIDNCTSRGIRVILTIFPSSPYYRQTDYFGRYGPLRSTATAIIQQISDLADNFDNCMFYDANLMGLHDYTDAEAFNWDHLSVEGAGKFSTRLDSILQEF
jgi:hypothetical protein